MSEKIIYNLNTDRVHVNNNGNITLLNLPRLYGEYGGCQATAKIDTIKNTDTVDTLSLKYDLKFIKNNNFSHLTEKLNSSDEFLWEWVRGGKLPGLELRLEGKSNSVSSRVKLSDIPTLHKLGCTVRPMWRSRGNITLYTYFNDMDKICYNEEGKVGSIIRNEHDINIVHAYEQACENFRIWDNMTYKRKKNSEKKDQFNFYDNTYNVEIFIKNPQAKNNSKPKIGLIIRNNEDAIYEQEVSCPSRLISIDFDVRFMVHFFYGGDDHSWSPTFLSAIEISNVEYSAGKKTAKYKFSKNSSNNPPIYSLVQQT